MPSTLNLLKESSSKRCPECDELIDSAAINIQEGVALCPACGALSRLSQLNDGDQSVREFLAAPPRGCSIDSGGDEVIATASLKSIGGFLASAGFALFWNGIVSVFLSLALAGLYTNLVDPVPPWFPAPGMVEGKPEMNGKPMGLGETLFLCMFLVPFVTVGAGMTVTAMMSLFGKVEVVVHRTEAYVATGIGILKWKRKFNPHKVSSVIF